MTWITAKFPDLPAAVRSRVFAYSTTRLGGLSEPPFQGLNLGKHVGDDASIVESNRSLLRQGEEGNPALPTEPYWLQQTHSNHVVSLPNEYDPKVETDASIAAQANLVCTIMTADCLPILIVNDSATEIAAIHAGWRGLHNGVIANTINKMTSKAERLHAWFGPAISQKQFEVGQDVVELFLEKDANYSSCFQPNSSGKYLCDMVAMARLQLGELGLKHISGGEFCTYTDATQFYSYRRDGQTGRMASFIWFI